MALKFNLFWGRVKKPLKKHISSRYYGLTYLDHESETDRCYLRCGSRGPVEASVDVPLELAWQVVILTRQPTLLEQLEAGGKDQPPQLVVGEGRRPCAAQAAARLWKHLRTADAPYGSGWWAWVLDRARPCGVS